MSPVGLANTRISTGYAQNLPDHCLTLHECLVFTMDCPHLLQLLISCGKKKETKLMLWLTASRIIDLSLNFVNGQLTQLLGIKDWVDFVMKMRCPLYNSVQHISLQIVCNPKLTFLVDLAQELALKTPRWSI